MRAVTESNFDREVLGADRPVLVDFWAPWCASCTRMAPTVDKVAAEHPEWDVVSVDVADAAAIAGRFGVLTLPTLLVFRAGNQIERLTGAQSEQAIIDLMSRAAPDNGTPCGTDGHADAAER